MRFPVRLWLAYGSLRWTGTIWQCEPAHLSEPICPHIIQSFIWGKVFKNRSSKICRRQPLKKFYLIHSWIFTPFIEYYFNDPNKGTGWFWNGLEVNQFLSYHCPLSLISTYYFNIYEINFIKQWSIMLLQVWQYSLKLTNISS